MGKWVGVGLVLVFLMGHSLEAGQAADFTSNLMQPRQPRPARFCTSILVRLKPGIPLSALLNTADAVDAHVVLFREANPYYGSPSSDLAVLDIGGPSLFAFLEDAEGIIEQVSLGEGVDYLLTPLDQIRIQQAFSPVLVQKLGEYLREEFQLTPAHLVNAFHPVHPEDPRFESFRERLHLDFPPRVVINQQQVVRYTPILDGFLMFQQAVPSDVIGIVHSYFVVVRNKDLVGNRTRYHFVFYHAKKNMGNDTSQRFLYQIVSDYFPD